MWLYYQYYGLQTPPPLIMHSAIYNRLQKNDWLAKFVVAGISRKHKANSNRAKKWRRQFRSNLTKVIKFLDGVELQKHHLELLQLTPFFHFLLPFINKTVNPKHVKGTKKGLISILDSYDKEQQVFVLAGKKLSITATEFEVIFGIPSGSTEIDMKDSTVSENSLGKRKFSNVLNITPSHLKTEIKQSMHSNMQQDIEDTVKLLILHTMSCVLFVASSDVVRWWMLRVCEDLSKLRDYNWGQSVVNYLTNFVQTSPSENVRGCTALLQVITTNTTTAYLYNYSCIQMKFLWKIAVLVLRKNKVSTAHPPRCTAPIQKMGSNKVKDCFTKPWSTIHRSKPSSHMPHYTKKVRDQQHVHPPCTALQTWG